MNCTLRKRTLRSTSLLHKIVVLSLVTVHAVAWSSDDSLQADAGYLTWQWLGGYPMSTAPEEQPPATGTPEDAVTDGHAIDSGGGAQSDTQNMSSWLQFYLSTGQNWGMPAAGDTALALVGSPAGEVAVGSAFDFTPQVSGVSGNDLYFEARNLPGWLQFDSATGRLWGTPAATDTALHGNIQIIAHNAGRSATLGPFTIAVVNGNLSVTLSWQAPTERVDGTPLLDLSGFRIYYGRQPNNRSRTIVIDNPGLSRHVIEGLTRGAWFFSITAVDSQGLESAHSNTVSADVG